MKTHSPVNAADAGDQVMCAIRGGTGGTGALREGLCFICGWIPRLHWAWTCISVTSCRLSSFLPREPRRANRTPGDGDGALDGEGLLPKLMPSVFICPCFKGSLLGVF